jgi:hypothetical protein
MAIFPEFFPVSRVTGPVEPFRILPVVGKPDPKTGVVQVELQNAAITVRVTYLTEALV